MVPIRTQRAGLVQAFLWRKKSKAPHIKTTQFLLQAVCEQNIPLQELLEFMEERIKSRDYCWRLQMVPENAY